MRDMRKIWIFYIGKLYLYPININIWYFWNRKKLEFDKMNKWIVAIQKNSTPHNFEIKFFTETKNTIELWKKKCFPLEIRYCEE